jgi:hypothetical protein
MTRHATLESRTFSVSIKRSVGDVYDFVSTPSNLPRWASGLGESIHKVDDEWIAETAQGPARVRFTERNKFGVLDHIVIPGPGTEIYVPMRVVSNGTGCEILLTLYRLPQMSEQEFERDAQWVQRDLDALKKLLEA